MRKLLSIMLTVVLLLTMVPASSAVLAAEVNPTTDSTQKLDDGNLVDLSATQSADEQEMGSDIDEPLNDGINPSVNPPTRAFNSCEIYEVSIQGIPSPVAGSNVSLRVVTNDWTTSIRVFEGSDLADSVEINLSSCTPTSMPDGTIVWVVSFKVSTVVGTINYFVAGVDDIDTPIAIQNAPQLEIPVVAVNSTDAPKVISVSPNILKRDETEQIKVRVIANSKATSVELYMQINGVLVMVWPNIGSDNHGEVAYGSSISGPTYSSATKYYTWDITFTPKIPVGTVNPYNLVLVGYALNNGVRSEPWTKSGLSITPHAVASINVPTGSLTINNLANIEVRTNMASDMVELVSASPDVSIQNGRIVSGDTTKFTGDNPAVTVSLNSATPQILSGQKVWKFSVYPNHSGEIRLLAKSYSENAKSSYDNDYVVYSTLKTVVVTAPSPEITSTVTARSTNSLSSSGYVGDTYQFVVKTNKSTNNVTLRCDELGLNKTYWPDDPDVKITTDSYSNLVWTISHVFDWAFNPSKTSVVTATCGYVYPLPPESPINNVNNSSGRTVSIILTEKVSAPTDVAISPATQYCGNEITVNTTTNTLADRIEIEAVYGNNTTLLVSATPNTAGVNIKDIGDLRTWTAKLKIPDNFFASIPSGVTPTYRICSSNYASVYTGKGITELAPQDLTVIDGWYFTSSLTLDIKTVEPNQLINISYATKNLGASDNIQVYVDRYYADDDNNGVPDLHPDGSTKLQPLQVLSHSNTGCTVRIPDISTTGNHTLTVVLDGDRFGTMSDMTGVSHKRTATINLIDKPGFKPMYQYTFTPTNNAASTAAIKIQVATNTNTTNLQLEVGSTLVWHYVPEAGFTNPAGITATYRTVNNEKLWDINIAPNTLPPGTYGITTSAYSDHNGSETINGDTRRYLTKNYTIR